MDILNELSKNDGKWREIALMITKGNKFEADELVSEMYIRRLDNDRGQPMTEYYILLTMKSIYSNQIISSRVLIDADFKDEVININNTEKYEISDLDKQILDRYVKLSYTEKELLRLTYDHSLRDIQKEFGINYGYAHRIITKARKQVLQGRINEYNNKRLKHRKMKSRGLGDTIEKITKALGIKKVVEMMLKDCGCDERKEYLNRVFNYKLEPRCFSEDELLTYADFVMDRKFSIVSSSKAVGEIQNKDIDYIVNTYNSIFSMNVETPECRGCAGAAKLLIDMVVKLDTVYLNNLPAEKKPEVKPKRKRRTKEEMKGVK